MGRTATAEGSAIGRMLRQMLRQRSVSAVSGSCEKRQCSPAEQLPRWKYKHGVSACMYTQREPRKQLPDM